MTIRYKETPEFTKDCKRLAKKHKTLAEDLANFQRVLSVMPEGNSNHFAMLRIHKGVKIIKARLFCRSLRGSSLRIIYAYILGRAEITFVGIEFIELYFKGDKEREDEERIKEYLSNLST